jgi:diphosphomevalonate decarboxylase
VDHVAVISKKHKKTGSSKGHWTAATSPFQPARVQTAPQRIAVCRQAILDKDFGALAEVSERDMTMMHGVMMTQNPPLFYWEPVTLKVIKAVHDWYEEGLDCFATVDAGPNVHVICTAEDSEEVHRRLEKITGIRSILSSRPGGKAHLV